MQKRWDKRKRKNFSRKVDNKTLLKFTHEFHFFQRKIKRKFLILIHIADTADSSGSELGWVRFGQTEPGWAVKLTQWLKVSWTSDENLRCEIITAQLLCAVSRQVTDKWRHNSWISSSFFLFASGMMCQNGLWKFPPPGRSFWITATSKHFCELIVCGSNIWILQAFRDFYKGKTIPN